MSDDAVNIPAPGEIRSSKIPREAATVGDFEPEADQFVSIHFSSYNEKLCEIKNLDPAKARKVVELLKKAGMTTPTKLHASGVRTRPVENAGDYTKFYNGLDPGIKLIEIYGASTSRIFYFDVGPQFYIRAITCGHQETDKSRKKGKQRR